MPFVPDQNTSTNSNFISKLLSGIGDSAKNTAEKVFYGPSQAIGGAIKASKEATSGTYQPPKIGPDFSIGNRPKTNLGNLINPALVGMNRGIQQKSSVMEELPKAIGADPDSIGGMSLGLAGEIATPDIADILTVGNVGSKFVQKIGKKFGEAGTTLAEAGVKPTKGQRESFFEATKKTIGKYIADKNLAGNVAENVAQKAGDLQSDFDDIAIRSGRVVRIKDWLVQAKESVNALDKIIEKSERSALQSFSKEISAKMRKLGGMGVEELTRMRKLLDDKIPASQWAKLLGGEAVSANVAKRMLLQDVIRKVTGDLVNKSGQTLEQIGKELSDLYRLKKIVGLQEGVTVAGRIGGFGDIAAGTAGFVGQEGDIPSRLKNGLLAILARRTISSPKFLGGTAKSLLETGDAMTRPGFVQNLAKFGITTGKEAIMDLTRQSHSDNNNPAPIQDENFDSWVRAGTTPGFISDDGGVE